MAVSCFYVTFFNQNAICGLGYQKISPWKRTSFEKRNKNFTLNLRTGFHLPKKLILFDSIKPL